MTALANNVILFPKQFSSDRGSAPQTIEEVIDSVESIKQLHIQECLETIVPIMFDRLAAAGFQPEDEIEFIKDGALIVESIRSFLLKIYSVNHPLQLIAEHLFEQTDDEGNLEVSDKVKLIINRNEDPETV
jgi:hypothetical protein